MEAMLFSSSYSSDSLLPLFLFFFSPSLPSTFCPYPNYPHSQTQPHSASYTCQVSGPGLHSATVNHPTHVLVELIDSSGRPCSLQQNVTADLEFISEDTTTGLSHKTDNVAAVISSSQYKMSYTAVGRGQHNLHVRVNNKEINGSPFTITVYPDPSKINCPVRVVTGIMTPYDIAINSNGQMVVSESKEHQLSIIDKSGTIIQKCVSSGEPAGVDIDKHNNLYVSSEHKLQKFNSSGELIKWVGQKGSGNEEFDDPRGVTLYNNQVYVCDRNNHRIQLFDLDLNWVKSISAHAKGIREFYSPFDVQFDTAGNIYIAVLNDERVQVTDTSGHFIRAIGHEGRGKLSSPSALHISDKYVYVSDFNSHCIVVYETSGQFVTKFGKHGHEKGEFDGPYCITSCVNGFIYVCDYWNNRVQIF